MNASVKISLDTRRPKKDGSFPIILRITHKRKTTSITTGYSVPIKYWDSKRGKIRKSYTGVANISRTNNFLEKQKAKAIDKLTRLEEDDKLIYLSIPEVKDKILGKAKDNSFFAFSEKVIGTLMNEDRIGNARSYKNVLREVKKFRNGIDFPFSELNYQFLKKFEHYYLAKGLSLNGLAVYMRTIRAIFNRAIKEELVDRRAYPFADYVIKTKPTKKRAIGYDAIQSIVTTKL